MTSQRFPGKVLAPLEGRPLVLHVVEAARSVLPNDDVVVATSDDVTDDPLAAYLTSIDVPCFRGPRDDVLGRFALCTESYPCDWVLRLNADSPRLGPDVLHLLLDAPRESCDLVTTTFPRTFPRGRNAELIRTATLRALLDEPLEPEDREHVTRWLYRHAEHYSICNVESGDHALAETSVAVDTVEDLRAMDGAPS